MKGIKRQSHNIYYACNIRNKQTNKIVEDSR